MSQKAHISNSLLLLGVLTLLAFAGLELFGFQSDPIVPAFAALFIGCTAVLDRIGVRQME